VSSVSRSSVIRSSVAATTPPPSTNELARTGGPEVITILAVTAGLIMSFIGFKVYKKRLNKVDIGNSK
jgi:hypothetical protein